MSLAALFIAVSSALGLPPNLLSSVCWAESKHDIKAMHVDDGGADSIGVCQIQYETAKQMGFKGTAAQLRAPYSNVFFAGLYLRHQLDRYHSDIPKAISAYNAGTALVNDKGQIMNRRYVLIVMNKWSATTYAQ